VRPEPHAQLGGAADHAVAVPLEPVDIEDERRGGKIVQQHA
jgi:hypothetical protein